MAFQLWADVYREAKAVEAVHRHLARSKQQRAQRQHLERIAESTHTWTGNTCALCGVSRVEVVLRKPTEDMRCPVV
jgi:hypothetical protein